jgi:serine/threonine-protein kinase
VDRPLHPTAPETLPLGSAQELPVVGDFSSAYVVCERLGRGGMGEVFRARQRRLQREVVIKAIRPDRSGPAWESAFRAEALVTAHLTHPHVLPVIDLLPGPDGRPRLILAPIEGGSWAQLLHPRDAAARRRAAGRDLWAHLRILQIIARTVAFAHRRGVLHRDLKPDNVLVGDFGEVLLCDWGLAVALDEHTARILPIPVAAEVVEAAGTPAYMAPEMARGDGRLLCPASDVYLLGAILYELLSGQPPHGGGSSSALQRSAAGRLPPPPPGPERLARLCREALEPDPAHRLADAGVFADLLETSLRHQDGNQACTTGRAWLRQAQDEQGHQDQRYEAYAAAIAAFRQARLPGEEHLAAEDGEHEARAAWAAAAIARGDLGLARAQLLAIGPRGAQAVAPLRQRLQAAESELARLGSRQRGHGIILLGLLVGLLLLVVLLPLWWWL